MDAHFSGSAKSVMDEFDRYHDKVDILVNDPRSMYARPLEEIDSEEWDEVQIRNAKSPFLLSQQVLPRMAKAKYGRVVNMISELAERGMINGSAFAASQAAVLALTRNLAVEWSRFNIRINAIGTGLIDTEGQSPVEQQEELLVRYTPLRRKGNPGDIGPLLVYLCSAFCDYSTGQPVYVDGGLNAHP
jgi:NAD(P)-dependent dehydrogenase (short-subunit alcohol dehydrogenase family)